MQKLTFTKNGLLCSVFDQPSAKWQDRNISDSDLPFTWYLPYAVVIEEGLTLREILTSLIKYEEQVNFMFVNYLKGFQLSELIKTITEAKKESDVEDIDAVCLLWVGQTKELEDEEEPFITTQPAIMALEMPDEDDIDSDQLHSVHSISPKQLMETQFVLDDLLEFVDAEDVDNPEFSGLVNWSVFDFVSSLLGELSIYAFVAGSVSDLEKFNLTPLSATDLFEHLDDLDKFFEAKDLDN